MRFNRFQVSGAIAGMALFVSSVLLPISSGTATPSQQSTSATEEFQIPSGGKRIGNQVIYEDGNVVLELTPSRSLSTRATRGARCPSGWFCLFEHAGYKGRMWKFKSRGYWQNLDRYGANRMSSYHNRLNSAVWINYPYNIVHCVSPGSSKYYIGNDYNDKAIAIQIRSYSLC